VETGAWTRARALGRSTDRERRRRLCLGRRLGELGLEGRGSGRRFPGPWASGVRAWAEERERQGRPARSAGEVAVASWARRRLGPAGPRAVGLDQAGWVEEAELGHGQCWACCWLLLTSWA
jgi:hypothetical protein